MPFERGDIIEVPFLIPHTNRYANHPCVIISNNDVYDADDCYICVMLTTSTIDDKFTFLIDNSMLVKPNNRDFSQARCHLISYVLEKHFVNILSKNRMKPNAVDRLVQYIVTMSLT